MNLSEKMKLIRGHLSQEEMAATLGVNKTRIVSLENDKAKKLSNEEIDKLVNQLNINVSWLITGVGAMRVYEASLDANKDFVYIPMLNDVQAAAGIGATVPDVEIVDSHLAFRRNWIKEQGISAKDASVIHVVGDSMFPTLTNGDVLLVDRSQRRLIIDKIYVFREEEGIMVKRFKSRSGNLLTLASDNQSIPDRTLDLEQNNDIIGRVVWVARVY
jgi:phage repressor protein C with HTH and peptisase S24 domain